MIPKQGHLICESILCKMILIDQSNIEVCFLPCAHVYVELFTITIVDRISFEASSGLSVHIYLKVSLHWFWQGSPYYQENYYNCSVTLHLSGRLYQQTASCPFPKNNFPRSRIAHFGSKCWNKMDFNCFPGIYCKHVFHYIQEPYKPILGIAFPRKGWNDGS